MNETAAAEVIRTLGSASLSRYAGSDHYKGSILKFENLKFKAATEGTTRSGRSDAVSGPSGGTRPRTPHIPGPSGAEVPALEPEDDVDDVELELELAKELRNLEPKVLQPHLEDNGGADGPIVSKPMEGHPLEGEHHGK